MCDALCIQVVQRVICCQGMPRRPGCSCCHESSDAFASVQALDRWEDRLEALFEGRPYDVLDAALTDTVSRYPVGACNPPL